MQSYVARESAAEGSCKRSMAVCREIAYVHVLPTRRTVSRMTPPVVGAATATAAADIRIPRHVVFVGP